MLKVGITGGIGSGKSLVCEIFKQLGIAVYHADTESKQLVNTDTEIRTKLIAQFGEQIYAQNNEIARKQLAALIFNDKQALNIVNSIVHPVVVQHFEQWILNHQNEKYILKEAAILFESDTYKNMDKIITVCSPLEIRIKRVMERDNTNRETILKRIENQLSDEDKIAQSDFVITNDEKQLIIPQVIEIHKILSL